MELKTQVVGPLRYLNPANIASFSDVKLVSVEGDCFYTNRLVLSSASLMFHGALQDIDLTSCIADEDLILVLTQFSSAHLRNVVDFVTRGVVFLSGDTDSAAAKGGLITNRQVLRDFFHFGIDLSTLLMLPVEDECLEKFFNFDQESTLPNALYPVELNDIKLEQMDVSMYQPELGLSEDELPLKRGVGRPRGSDKDKKLTKTTLKRKQKLTKKGKKIKETKKLKLELKAQKRKMYDAI